MGGSIVRESEKLIQNIQEWDEKEGFENNKNTGYGHALRTFSAQADANKDASPESQRIFLRTQALDLIGKFGEPIKKVMKPELLEALNIKDK